MNEEAGIKGFLSDYKCYISYLKDMLGDGEFLSFADFCRSQEREEITSEGYDGPKFPWPRKCVADEILRLQAAYNADRERCSANPDLDTPPGYFAQGMGW